MPAASQNRATGGTTGKPEQQLQSACSSDVKGPPIFSLVRVKPHNITRTETAAVLEGAERLGFDQAKIDAALVLVISHRLAKQQSLLQQHICLSPKTFSPNCLHGAGGV